jgi:hypothetical protein
LQELPKVCAELNGIGNACTHKMYRLYVHDAIVACSTRLFAYFWALRYNGAGCSGCEESNRV